MTNARYQRIRRKTPSLLRDLEAALLRYSRREGCTLEFAVRDALTDLRHSCDIHGLSFAELDRRAYRGYQEELEYSQEQQEVR